MPTRLLVLTLCLTLVPVPASSQTWLPRILLHLVPAGPGRTCQDGVLEDCRNAVVRGEVSTPGSFHPYYAFVLGNRNAIADLRYFDMRIRYDGTVGRGVDIFQWTNCSGHSDIPWDNWPATNGSNTFTWLSCPQGSNYGSVVAGYFYMAAYSPDSLRVIPTYGDAHNGGCSWNSCIASSYGVYPEHLGLVAFSEGATAPGCTPCLGDCPPVPAPPPPPPGIDAGPKILVHVTAPVAKNACATGQISNCADAVTQAGLSTADGPFHYIYLLAGRGPLPELAGLQCGIEYDRNQAGGASNAQGLDVFSWTLCATLEFPSGPNPWPEPLSGNLITWVTCPTTPYRVAGYFYAAAYDSDRFRLIARPVDGQAKVAVCSGAETVIDEGDLGYATFSPGGTASGCNPCFESCQQPTPLEVTTWSRIKSMNAR